MANSGLWRCKCGHEVISQAKPEPINWTDGHVCHFHQAEEPERIVCHAGILRSDHWVGYGAKMVSNSPMFHVDDYCPGKGRQCSRDCGNLEVSKRPCTKRLNTIKGQGVKPKEA